MSRDGESTLWDLESWARSGSATPVGAAIVDQNAPASVPSGGARWWPPV